ncbi:MAG: hypothetical protein JO168_17245 [Solirubrobacterales bacterium]|nr:hypothetical protein [Solirubrobacterales bacterium]
MGPAGATGETNPATRRTLRTGRRAHTARSSWPPPADPLEDLLARPREVAHTRLALHAGMADRSVESGSLEHEPGVLDVLGPHGPHPAEDDCGDDRRDQRRARAGARLFADEGERVAVRSAD